MMDLDKARELYASGRALPSIACELGVPCSSLYQALTLDGWRARPQGWHRLMTDAQRDEVQRLAGRNVQLSVIASTVGVCEESARKVIRAAGIERQRCGKTTAPMRRVFLYGPGDVPTRKWCAECSSYHSVAAFGRNRRLKHGIAQMCRKCNAQRTRAYAARRKTQASASR